MNELDPLLVPVPHRVIDKAEEAPDVTTLHVTPADGSPPPPFRPAQVGMLGAFGIGEAAISISSPVASTDHHAYTIRRTGPITSALVGTPVGGTITVRGPFGQPWPIDEIATGSLVIVGGGLGMAPLRAVTEEAVVDRPDLAVAVAYGATRPDLLLYPADLDRWRAAGAHIALTVDRADDAGTWTGPVGLVTGLLDAPAGIQLDWSDTTAFVCGPDVMMHHTAAALRRLGVSRARIWLTLERNMQCGNALCGHCQLGPFIICRDGPVVRYDRIAPFHPVPEL